VRKLLAVPTLVSLALAPSAMALPSEQSFNESTKASPAAPPAGAAYPVRPHNGQAAAPKPGRTPRQPRPAAVAVPAQLQAIAACESGGNPAAVDSTGTYHGKYQFTTANWQGIGGSGDPAKAPEAEQDRRAIALYARSGPGQWPVCSQ